MICPKCGIENVVGAQVCHRCGAPMGMIQPPPGQSPQRFQQPMPQQQPPQYAPMAVYQPPVAPPPYAVPHLPVPFIRKAYTWKDICTIIGFASSILGVFTFWLVLCPVGLLCSILGFHGDRTKGYAVAGIIIASLAILIKLGFILYDLNLLPEWLTSGVFWNW